MDGLGLPWWTYEGARCAFLRPLASLTHAVDYALFPHGVALMHVHNLFWFGVMIWAAGRAYGAMLDSRLVAAIALTMFAFDSSHGMAVSWISNRNALLSGALSFATLYCHQHARRSGSRRYTFAAWLAFALALLSGELALALLIPNSAWPLPHA
jgi:hypothetical protein